MPKNQKPKATCQAGANEKLLKQILSEIEALRAKLKKQTHAQKKTSRELQSLKKQIAKTEACVCAKKKNKKAKKQKVARSESVVSTASEPISLTNTISSPLNGSADDLKWISGVGPKLEETLNGLGIYHFDQVAAWTKQEIDWVDDYLKFSGRIERDNWIEQAKALAKGGWDEYVKVFGKEPR